MLALAFSPATLQVRSFAWEQGLPDFQADRAERVTQRAYAAGMRLRYGVSGRWEVQPAARLHEQTDTSGPGQVLAAASVGDLSLAVNGRPDAGRGQIRYGAPGRRVLADGAEGRWPGAEQQPLALHTNVDLLDSGTRKISRIPRLPPVA